MLPLCFSLIGLRDIQIVNILRLSIQFQWPICILLYQYHTVVITVTLQVWKSGNVWSSNLFFFKIILVIPDSLRFHINLRVNYAVLAPPPKRNPWNFD